MPFAGYENFDACVASNQDKNDPEAYCAAIQQEVEGKQAMSPVALAASDRDPCWEGYEQVGMKEGENGPVPNCVPKGKSNKAMSALVFTMRDLEGAPIRRQSLGNNKVRYRDVKLLSPGIWTDAGSQSAAYYSPDGIRNLRAEYDPNKYPGPPVNIQHDVDMATGETHDASVAGYVDPNSLAVDDADNLYGDIVIDRSRSAGAYADDNLMSALESKGRLGFGGPSVEIPAKGLQEVFDPARNMPEIKGGLISGLGLVMDPAAKTVSFAKEVARRGVAMSGTNTKSYYLKRSLMDTDGIRDVMDRYGIETGGKSDEELAMMAEEVAVMAPEDEEPMLPEDRQAMYEEDEMYDDSLGEEDEMMQDAPGPMPPMDEEEELDMTVEMEEEEMYEDEEEMAMAEGMEEDEDEMDMQMGDMPYDDEEEEMEMGGMPRDQNPLLNPDTPDDEDRDMSYSPQKGSLPQPMNADEDQLMEDDMDEEEMVDDVGGLEQRVANLEDAISQVMSAPRVRQEIKRELSRVNRRLSAVERRPRSSKTLADSEGSEWADADLGIINTGPGSYSR